MAKNKSNYRPFQTAKGGKITVIFDDMIKSKAFSKLSGNSVRLLLLQYNKLQVKYIQGQVEKTNENNISIPKSEYEIYMSQSAFEKAIDELIEFGFMKVIEYKNTGGSRKLIIYGFNDIWKYYETDKFNIRDEWRRSAKRNKQNKNGIEKQYRAVLKNNIGKEKVINLDTEKQYREKVM